MADWNPRYLAYCKAHNKMPEEMLEHDREAWPGGQMCGFLIWHNARLLEAKAQYPQWFMYNHLIDDRPYDAWLQSRKAN